MIYRYKTHRMEKKLILLDRAKLFENFASLTILGIFNFLKLKNHKKKEFVLSGQNS